MNRNYILDSGWDGLDHHPKSGRIGVCEDLVVGHYE